MEAINQGAIKLKELKNVNFDLDALIKKNVMIKPIRPDNGYRNGVYGLDTPMFPFVKHYLTLGYLDETGTGANIRYLTGLDEFSKDMLQLRIQNIDEYYRRVYEIRKVVAYLLEFDSIKTDIDDPDFWVNNKYRPNNVEFWSKQKIILEPTGTTLNLMNPSDLITYYCIKGGGYDVIAPSVDEIKREHYFYLDENKRSVEVEAKKVHNRNKVLGYLYDLYSSNRYSVLISLANIVDVKSAMFISDGNQAYSVLSNWIVDGTPRIGKEAVLDKIISVIDKPINYISVRAFVEKLINRGRMVYREKERTYFSHDLGISVGKDIDEVVTFLSLEGSRKDLLMLLETYKNEYYLNPNDFDVYKTQNTIGNRISDANNDDVNGGNDTSNNEIKRIPFQKKGK